MRITTVETFILGERELLVRIGTDTDLVGWGDASLEHKPQATAAMVRELSGLLIGKDPLPVTDHWNQLTRAGFYRGGSVHASAVAGLDQALWDLRGKHWNAPIHELLGGPTREKVRMYTHTWGSEGHTGSPERTRMLKEWGYTLVKASIVGPVPFLAPPEVEERFVADLEAQREACGPEMDFAIDLHGRVSVPQARRLAEAVAHTRVAFLEEPLRPEHSHELHRITASSTVPIATGERFFSREDFLPALQQGIAIAQPDLAHCGGISECFRIATMAESFDVQVAPHCPIGPVALAACLQLDLAIPNFYAQEHIIDLHTADSHDLRYLRNPEALVAVDGHVARLTGPGLGLDIDEDRVRTEALTEPFVPEGNPRWRYSDGSFAEW